MIQQAGLRMTYRGSLRSRSRLVADSTRLWRVISGVSELIQFLSERFGLMKMVTNIAAMVALGLLLAPYLLLLAVRRLLAQLLDYLYGPDKPVITGRNDRQIIGVYLIERLIDGARLRADIQAFGTASKLLKLKPWPMLCGRLNVWRDGVGGGNFVVGNHLIELPPVWKHRNVTEETADEYVSQVCTQPLTKECPWKLFLLPLLEDGAGARSRTCLVSQCRPMMAPLVAEYVAAYLDADPLPMSHPKLSGSVRMSSGERIERLGLELTISAVELQRRIFEFFRWSTIRRLLRSAADGHLPAIRLPPQWRRAADWKVKLTSAWRQLIIGFNTPRRLLRDAWRRSGGRCVQPRSLRWGAEASSTGNRMCVTWSQSIPRDFVESVCQAARAGVEHVVLTALSQSLADHFKQTGMAPESLPLTWTSVAGGLKQHLELPCCQPDGRIILQCIQQQCEQRQLTDRWALDDYLKRIMRAEQPPVLLQTVEHVPGTRSAFQWTLPVAPTQLHLCLSVGACNVQLGAACHVLTPQQLWLIVDHLERHIYQLAASYGVQWRRLSRHSTTKFA